jgi:lipopolysaccharide biosynthesis protein
MRRLSTVRKQARRAVGSTRRRIKARVANLRNAISDARDVGRTRSARRSLGRTPASSAATAVVIHLFYVEVWPSLTARLTRLKNHDVDVFVTIPKRNKHAIPLIRASFPDARCIVVPNRGRDVLPFVIVAKHLASVGYVAVLKLHSKKSEHFGGGDHWRDGMIDELVPEDPSAVTAILDVLREPQTGVVGPRSTYFPLSTYWAGNAANIDRLLRPAVPADALARLDNPKELGFFAGTMFWVRLDAVRPLLDVDPLDFAREPTPKDGTLAHALERAFSVLPELLGRDQYDTDGTRVAHRAAVADPLPEWYRSATMAAIAARRSTP